MAVAWPDGVPFRVKRDGASYAPGETVGRSNTDSGLARQRAITTAAPDMLNGVIPMSASARDAFLAWRKALQGAVFTYPEHPFTLAPVSARFVAGGQGALTPDGSTARINVPVQIEFIP